MKVKKAVSRGGPVPSVTRGRAVKENAPVITEHCCTNADRDGNG